MEKENLKIIKNWNWIFQILQSKIFSLEFGEAKKRKLLSWIKKIENHYSFPGFSLFPPV